MTLEKNLEEEQKVQKEIFDAINNFKSFCLNAGAGSGKTYALIESIKYVLLNKQVELHKHNQKIICVTYTNVAVNEIKERLGNTEFVLVSTIHEMLWEQIKVYQKNELIDLHQEKLRDELNKIQEKIDGYKEDQNLSVIFNENLESFLSLIQETKELFYENRDYSANIFKACYIHYIPEHGYLPLALKNVGNFKKLVELFYKEERYTRALERINNPQKRKKIKIQYDNNFNSDRLPLMMISHDTLLKYSYSLFELYPMFRRIIIDKYPYFFIDEYQDTNKNVIKLVEILHRYASDKKKKWLVGYFGDDKQNIYNDGVGSDIFTIHRDLKKINKQFNRRATNQLIELINKIRDDDIIQKPINPECINGEIKFFYSKDLDNDSQINKIQRFINQFEASIPDNQTIDCLVPVNRLLASLCGFKAVYDSIWDSKIIYWDVFNSQFLSKQHDKLHPAVFFYYRLVMLYKRLKSDRTTYYDILGETNNNVTLKDAKKTIKSLVDSINEVTNLDQMLKGLSSVISQKNIGSSNSAIKYCLNHSLSITYSDIKNYDTFYEYIKDTIYTNMFGDENENSLIKEKNNNMIQEILNVNLTEWLNWVSFINEERDDNTKVIYHTYHGTKGEEYDNVAIIMEHKFGGTGNGKNKFKNYFAHIQCSKEEQEQKLQDENYKKQLENTQNLIYVACSRAKKNLQILYLDDITEIKDGLEMLFGEINEFN